MTDRRAPFSSALGSMLRIVTSRLGIACGLLLGLTIPASGVLAQESALLEVSGLDQPVEILVDRWGISHIYAETEHDLFFTQGWNAARDRLFQLELWRRQATGTVAEILGPREIERDRGTRLFKFRRNLEQELSHYHPNGVAIIGAYVDGINAYVERTRRDPSLLPIEFELLGISPGRWTSEIVISRHQGLLGNIGAELRTGRLVAELGAAKVKDLGTYGPGDPLLALDPEIDRAALSADILGVYNAFRGRVRFRPEDIVAEHRGDAESFARLERAAEASSTALAYDPELDVGSNNWVVSGARSESGYPIMANDPIGCRRRRRCGTGYTSWGPAGTSSVGASPASRVSRSGTTATVPGG